MSKQLFQDNYAMNIVVERLIGPDAKDKYNPSPSQWPNGQVSDIVYIPNSNASKEFPPIIVETQHVVDIKFLLQVMSYCYQLYNQFGVVPAVLIFGISRIKPEVLLHCKPCRKHPFLLQYRKETWAQFCYLADSNSVKLGLNDIPLPPLASLSLFLTGRYRSLSMNPFKADPTMQELYKVSKKIFSDQITDNDDMHEECLGICKLVNDKVKEVSALLRADVPDATLRARTEAQLMMMSSILTDFQEKYQSLSSASASASASPSSSSSSSSSAASSSAPSSAPAPASQPDQWSFVADYVNNHKSKNIDNNSKEPVPWEAIFRDGQSKGYFSSIKSSNSMRATFYRYRKANAL